MTGRIIRGVGGFYYVHDGAALYQCRAKGIFRKNHEKPLVGDRVEFSTVFDSEIENAGSIDRILERSSQLVRPALANVDQIFLIFSAKTPAPNFDMLNSYLCLVHDTEIPVVLIVNKCDLCTEEELQEIRDAFSVSVKGKNNQIALFQYQQALLKELPVIHEAIAKLDYDICDENSFVDVAPPIEYQYACEHIFDEHKADLMDFGISKMKQYFGDIINYDECQSRLEIAVLTKAGIYLTQNIKPASANTIYLSSQE